MRHSLWGLWLVLMLAACSVPGRKQASDIATPTPRSSGTSTPTRTPRPLTFVTPTSNRIPPTPEPTATTVPTIASVVGSTRAAPLPRDAVVYLLGWTVTILDVVRGNAATTTLMERNAYNRPAPDGYDYVLVTLEAENNADTQEPQNPRYGIQLGITGERNAVYSDAGAVTPLEFEDEVLPGGSARGQIAILVPQDEANLVFMFQDQASFGGGIQFVEFTPAASIRIDPTLEDITATAIGTDPANPAALGETATTDQWQLSVVEVLRGEEATRRIMAQNEYTRAPEYTAEFLAIKVRMRLLDTTDPDVPRFVNGSYFTVRNDRTLAEPLMLVGPEPHLQAHLFAGGSDEGWLAFEVPTLEKDLMLVFRSVAVTNSGDTRYFVLNE